VQTLRRAARHVKVKVKVKVKLKVMVKVKTKVVEWTLERVACRLTVENSGNVDATSGLSRHLAAPGRNLQ